tara:strand:+ start:66 stop:512 length:447 start_codon:yes stop_codon:yes gene_type:complete
MDAKEKEKQYKKEWYQKNKEKVIQRSKEWVSKPENKEKVKEYKKEYREKPENKEKRKEYNKEYCQSEAGKKSYRIYGWKRQGIITEDYDKLYEKFMNTENCELCNVVLTTSRYTTKTTRCMDHDHDITDRNNVRNIVCIACNNSLPKQ